jgi:hypothetical protein
MPTFAKRYQILRSISSTSRKPCTKQPSEKPIMVAFLLNEAEFENSGGKIEHHKTVFLDDPGHDWDWRQGSFFYYSHALGLEDTGDILVIYETQQR